MAFPTPGAAVNTNNIAATAVAEPANKDKYEAEYDAATAVKTVAPAKTETIAPVAKQPLEKIDMQPLLLRLKTRLEQNEELRTKGEPVPLTMAQLAQLAPDLRAGVERVLSHFELSYAEDTEALRFVPETVDEDGNMRNANLYFLSIAANAEDSSCVLRWGNGTKDFDATEALYTIGVRIIGSNAVLKTPSVACPLGLLNKAQMAEAQIQAMALAENFGELAAYLKQSSASNILSELPADFLMYLTSAEDRTSKKGNTYTVLEGTQLNSESQPIGDCGIFSPGKDAAFWADKLNKVVLQFDAAAKALNIINAETGDLIETLAMMPKTLKLKELEVGETYDWLGCELVQFKSSKGWVISLRKQGTTNVQQCYTNRAIENVISGGAAMILEAAGLPTDDLDAIFKVHSTEPFGTIHIKGHKPYASGVSVQVEAKINKSEADKKEEDALFASLGIL